jgi:arginase
MNYDIEIISAPSILGLRPDGVELLADRLLEAGIAEKTGTTHPVQEVPTLNAQYSKKRDDQTHCLNPVLLRDFSLTLNKVIGDSIGQQRFPLVLGGDCSILLGIMPALRSMGNYGLIFIDAHADFYEPEKSITGEVADMDLAMVTGRGPELLTNINGLRPYVSDEYVVHIGQRDWEETQRFESQDIRETTIACFDLAYIEQKGISATTTEVVQHIHGLSANGYWIHFDTDVLSDDINPAVNYRNPGGLQFEQAAYLMSHLLSTGKITGMSVTCYNPKMDTNGQIGKNIAATIGTVLKK